MLTDTRRGKVNQLLIATIPPIVFLAGLMIYNAYRFVKPADFSVEKTRAVEALEVIGGVSPLAKNGLPIPQPQSVRAGGSSKLVVTRQASDGDYIMVSGSISAGYLASKIELDKMLHLRLQRRDFRITSDGEEIGAIVLVPRTETNPLVVDDPSTDPNDPAFGNLFVNPSLLSIPAGTATAGQFVSDNGMSVQATPSLGNTGSLGMPAAQLHFTLDADSKAWVTMPTTYRVQHTAIGSADVQIGILIPRNAGSGGSFEVNILGESVATVSQR